MTTKEQIDDCAAAHFVGGELQRVVASRPGAGAYQVTIDRTAPRISAALKWFEDGSCFGVPPD